MPRTPKLFLTHEERRKLIENPPKGAWIEKRSREGRIYYYMRWREGKEKFTLAITEEEAEEIRRRLKKECQLPNLEEFYQKLEKLAREGNEEAQYLLKRWKREKGIVRRVLELLSS